MPDVNDLFIAPEGEELDFSKVIDELKSKRYIDLPNVELSKKGLNPKEHDVCNRIKRPDKKIKIDPDDPDYYPENETVLNVTAGAARQSGYRLEPVARVALAIQKLIVKRAVSFIFGNPVELDATPENDNEKIVMKALKRVMYDVKERSFNRRVARELFSSTEVAEVWYPIQKENSIYGFDSNFKLRCGIFSPMRGDTLYPYFDETGDMVAFSRAFSIKDHNQKTTSYFETYTDKFHFLWALSDGGYTLVDGYPAENAIGKIPVIYGHQQHVEWEDVQNLIDRLEKLLSNFADTNDYFASPKIFVKGELKGFAKKGESGAIIQADGEADAKYLSWDNAPEAVKLEIETLLRMIYTITQTPDISFEAVKGLGAISGIALKLLFMDAHLKVADHQEVFDEYLQRRINVVKAYIGKFNTKLATDAENLFVEPVITPYIIRDEAAELKIWSDANGGNAVMSQKASFQKAGMTQDPDSDYDQYLKEQDSATSRQNSFALNEPTPA
jgi:SPP1 family phage portal protein